MVRNPGRLLAFTLAFATCHVGCSSSSKNDEPTGSGGSGGSAGSSSGVKRVFVTSKTYSGNLLTEGGGASGLAGADNLCNQLGATLGGTWVAWLSEGASAFDRVTGQGPWYRVDGTTLVFPDREALKGLPLVPISTDELGLTHNTDLQAWTGTDVGGTISATGTRCLGWSSGVGFFGQYGDITVSGPQWTNAGLDGCEMGDNRLICFEL